ncbi:hypothetical protein ACOME3_010067 [Neoechinorhynchus agilis]
MPLRSSDNAAIKIFYKGTLDEALNRHFTMSQGERRKRKASFTCDPLSTPAYSKKIQRADIPINNEFQTINSHNCYYQQHVFTSDDGGYYFPSVTDNNANVQPMYANSPYVSIDQQTTNQIAPEHLLDVNSTPGVYNCTPYFMQNESSSSSSGCIHAQFPTILRQGNIPLFANYSGTNMDHRYRSTTY